MYDIVKVRRFVYERCIEAGRPPSRADTAAGLGFTLAIVDAAFRRLAEEHVLVLQQNGEIMMAAPFSAVPTTFQVRVGDRSWWGNCAWDALGIPAMLGRSARLLTACGDCNEEIDLRVAGGALADADCVMHVAVPARRWWDDVVFT